MNYDLTTTPRFMDDTTLVAGLQRGDVVTVEYAVQHYAPAIYRFAYYQVQDAAVAEDVVSEVMIRMVGQIDAFVPERATLQAWLFRIARNLIADHYRARKRRPQISLEGWLQEDPANEPGGPDPQMQVVLDRDQLHAGLVALTDEQRQVVLLHVIEGWELPQVADLLGRSLASVKGLYYRGVQSLRRALTHPAEITEGTNERTDLKESDKDV